MNGTTMPSQPSQAEKNATLMESRMALDPGREVPVRLMGGMLAVFLASILVGCEGSAELSGSRASASADPASGGSHSSTDGNSRQRVRVSVMNPTSQDKSKKRAITEPGSCQSFEVVDLFAKVSGYLKNQKVDIGDPVKEGDVLAEIDAPELQQAVVEAQAQVTKSQAQTAQKKAAVSAEEADLTAAEAALRQTQADLQGFQAEVTLRKEQYARMKKLADEGAVEKELVDEASAQQQVAVSKESAGEKAVVTANADVVAARGHVEEAKADLAAAKAAEEVSQASLKTAQQFQEYTNIRAPFNGVVTARNYFNRDFVRAATGGGQVAQISSPLLRVARIDMMRVVVQIPDKDAPHVRVGDPAMLAIDSLPNHKFSGTVSRMAKSQAYKTRTMRAEFDLPNPEGLLQDGMYGTATITLTHAPPGVVIPSKCLFTSGDGTRFVYVVDHEAAHRRDVELDVDNGLDARIASGLSPSDRVVYKHGAGIADGVSVEVVSPGTTQEKEPSGGSDASESRSPKQ